MALEGGCSLVSGGLAFGIGLGVEIAVRLVVQAVVFVVEVGLIVEA